MKALLWIQQWLLRVFREVHGKKALALETEKRVAAALAPTLANVGRWVPNPAYETASHEMGADGNFYLREKK